jgi:hypothetical protein
MCFDYLLVICDQRKKNLFIVCNVLDELKQGNLIIPDDVAPGVVAGMSDHALAKVQELTHKLLLLFADDGYTGC